MIMIQKIIVNYRIIKQNIKKTCMIIEREQRPFISMFSTTRSESAVRGEELLIKNQLNPNIR